MLIGRTKHIFYFKIQASSDNDRIRFLKKRRIKKKTNILCCFMVFLAFVCMFTQLKSVYIVIKLIVHYNHQCQLLSVGFFNPFDVKR